MRLDQIEAGAVSLKATTVLLWILASPFVVIGVVLRLVWLAPAFLISSAVEGWLLADRAYKRWRSGARDKASRRG